jgi:enamine deaminase RidA (YjgF/YER057c/UK114 family)
MTNGQSGERVVLGTIDAGGAYCSRLAAGGGFVFLGGTAIDRSGDLPEAARPQPPYDQSAAARANAQTRYLFGQYRDLLPKLGSSVEDIVQLEQYVQRKVHADSYFAVATSGEFMGSARPAAATAQVGDYFPADAAVSVTGLALIPDAAAGFEKTYPGEEAGGNRKFSEAIAAGPYYFTTIFPSDRKAGVPAEVKVPEWIWSGSEIKREAQWGLKVLAERLESVGASLADVVDYTVFLTDAADLYEFDEVLRKALGPDAPSRTVIPSKGFALPRREGAFGHGDGAPRSEIQFRCLLPGKGATKTIVDGPGAGFGYQSAGVKAGPLLWLSSQVADTDQRGGAAQEVAGAFAKLETTCRNAGTDLTSLLRVRAIFTDAADVPVFFAALREAVPSDPPAVAIAVVDRPLHDAGASVAIDGVALVGGK